MKGFIVDYYDLGGGSDNKDSLFQQHILIEGEKVWSKRKLVLGTNESSSSSSYTLGSMIIHKQMLISCGGSQPGLESSANVGLPN